MEISEITRRNILDELRASQITWHGRLSEVEFLNRVYPLQDMPSYDMRFSNMYEDIVQHRVNNFDWDDDWAFNDKRINLLQCEDKLFLNFVCETVHPVIRANLEETKNLLKIYNEYLGVDGYEICEIRKISGRPVFSAQHTTTPVIFESITKVDSAFAKEQIEKCNAKLQNNDFDGAVSNARSLVEAVLGEIYNKCTNQSLEKTGDLLNDFKKIKGLLNLSEEKYSHEGIQGMIRAFNGIIQNIDTLSNRMGDRHRPLIRPARHHAKLVVDSAISISDFLISSMEYQNSKINTFLNRLLEILDTGKRGWTRDNLLQDDEIRELLEVSDIYLRQAVKNNFFKRFEVNSFRKSDIYFAVMEIFLDELDSEDIATIYVASQTNDQMVGWDYFEKELRKHKSNQLDEAYRKVYEQ